MPTPLPPGEKTAFIDIVSVVNPIEADRLQDILVNYDDVVTAIGRQINVFASNPGYLKECIAVFTDSDLQNVGIYNNKTSITPPLNPNVIINSTYSGDVGITANDIKLWILGSSTVDSITVDTNIVLDQLYIGPNSVVSLLDSTDSGACVDMIQMPLLNTQGGTLSLVQFGSCLGLLLIDDGVKYGGIGNAPTGSCATPVTNLVIGAVTGNTMELTWVPPTNYLFIDVFYKESDSNTWIKATSQDGDFISNTGYNFTKLQGDTFYSFKVTATCVNGVTADALVGPQQTNCCS